jgi:hypothetical protein
MGPQVAPGTVLDPAKAMDYALTQLEIRWTNVAKAMPAEKYSFAPSNAIFAPGQDVKFDGVPTFAQIVTHMILVNYRSFQGVGHARPDIDDATLLKLTSKDDILAALAAFFVFAHRAVANVTPANAFEVVAGMLTRSTAFTWAFANTEEAYGQAVEYMRMSAILPPGGQSR